MLVDRIADLRASWNHVQHSRPFQTIAAVVLPNHLHVVLTLPDGDGDYSTRVRLLKTGFTRRLPTAFKSNDRKGQRGIWQKRYWEHAVRDDTDMGAYVDYIHFNPVKHGLVASPDDWPYSTWHRWKQEVAKPYVVPADWKPPPEIEDE